MPGGDRTGPMGQGPMTGRAAGYCAGYPVPGFANPAWGYGRGWGRGFGRGAGGRGRGWGRGWGRGQAPGWGYAAPWAYPQTPAPAYPGAWAPGAAYGGPWNYPTTAGDRPSETEVLKEQADFLQQQLKAVEARLEELESDEED